MPVSPRKACDVTVDPAGTAEQATRDMLRECHDQIVANVAVVRRLDDPEGPHQLRIGLRRLRSVFSVCAPVLGGPEMQRLKVEARWLGQEVGNLRNLDVVADDMVSKEAGNHSDETSLRALMAALQRLRASRREELRAVLAGARVQAFLIDLARFTETRGWQAPRDSGRTERLAAPIADIAGQALDQCWKKVGKKARGLATLSIDQRHELRKELKKLRYAVEFFAGLFPAKRVNPFLKRLKKMQIVFGDLNDAALVKTMFTGPGFTGADGEGDEPILQRAAGWMIGASAARAEAGWAGAKTRWRDLGRTRPFWR